ncbi:MAG: hypothetical protein ACLSVG_07980 [Clostridia bacterium]
MKKHRILPAIFAILFIGSMAGVSEWLHEPEILFPEIAAIAIGAWLSPKTVWRTNKFRLFLSILLCAVCGVLIVRYCRIPLILQLLLALILSQLFLSISRTSFAPMCSAIILPVLLGTTSWIYPISAGIMTGCILIVQMGMERTALRAPLSFDPVRIPARMVFGRFSFFYKRILIAGLLLTAAAASGWRFLAAPPLLVAFTELSDSECPARGQPLKTFFFPAACALSGCVLRYCFCVVLQMPLTLAVLVQAALLVFAVQSAHFYFPPAGAMAILPFLIPENALFSFPFQVAVGYAFLICAALFFFPTAEHAVKAIKEVVAAHIISR